MEQLQLVLLRQQLLPPRLQQEEPQPLQLQQPLLLHLQLEQLLQLLLAMVSIGFFFNYQ